LEIACSSIVDYMGKCLLYLVRLITLSS
jgi:hypothetical protein